MSDVDQLSLLAVGVSGLVESSPEIDVRYAVSAQETIAILRLMSFDLLLAGKKIPDCTVSGPTWLAVKKAGGPSIHIAKPQNGRTRTGVYSILGPEENDSRNALRVGLVSCATNHVIPGPKQSARHKR